MENFSKLVYVYDLTPYQGLGHFTRTNRLIKEFRRNGVKCYLALEKKHKDFHEKVIRKENPIYFEKTLESFRTFVRTLRINKINSVLIDSYSIGFKWEKYLNNNEWIISDNG